MPQTLPGKLRQPSDPPPGKNSGSAHDINYSKEF